MRDLLCFTRPVGKPTGALPRPRARVLTCPRRASGTAGCCAADRSWGRSSAKRARGSTGFSAAARAGRAPSPARRRGCRSARAGAGCRSATASFETDRERDPTFAFPDRFLFPAEVGEREAERRGGAVRHRVVAKLLFERLPRLFGVGAHVRRVALEGVGLREAEGPDPRSSSNALASGGPGALALPLVQGARRDPSNSQRRRRASVGSTSFAAASELRPEQREGLPSPRNVVALFSRKSRVVGARGRVTIEGFARLGIAPHPEERLPSRRGIRLTVDRAAPLLKVSTAASQRPRPSSASAVNVRFKRLRREAQRL